VIADDARRHGLQEKTALLAAHTDEVLGRWAAVMLNADVYAEVIDRHVELAGDISWLSGLLDSSDPPDDHRRQLRARSNPAVQIEGRLADDEFALRIVPLEWWRARLGASGPAPLR
jgi:hypothetical protein